MRITPGNKLVPAVYARFLWETKTFEMSVMQVLSSHLSGESWRIILSGKDFTIALYSPVGIYADPGMY